jgi:glycosyltransferase involved in cell wall biosynthesis
MLAGKPVVATSVGGIVEIIEHRANGLLVPPASPHDLADAIDELLTNRDLAQRLAAKGRSDAEITYSPDSHARNILSVYRELI